MQAPRVMSLSLRAPLVYSAVPGGTPFATPETGESMAVYDLAAEEGEPLGLEASDPLPAPAFVGARAPEGSTRIDEGTYLFMQVRAAPEPALVAAAAHELRKEGAWRRGSLGRNLYVRALAEEEGPVFQVMRQYEPPSGSESD